VRGVPQTVLTVVTYVALGSKVAATDVLASAVVLDASDTRAADHGTHEPFRGSGASLVRSVPGTPARNMPSMPGSMRSIIITA
jgi:hypothetical protein